MIVHLVPVYKDIFIDEPVPDRLELLKQLPSEALIRVCCHINTQLYLNDKTLEKEVEIFHYLIGRLREDGQKYSDRLTDFIRKANPHGVEIFPIQHTLTLIQESFFLNVEGDVKNVSVEQELSILKLFLLLNTDTNRRVSKSLVGKIKDASEKLYSLFWCNLLPVISFIQKRDSMIGMYKSLNFLEFLNANYAEYLKEYLKKNKVDAYQKIPIKLFEWYVNSYKKEDGNFYSSSTSEFAKQNGVIEQLVVALDTNRRDELEKSGYKKNLKLIREFPIIQTSAEQVSITNFNFLIEKFYEGLFFDFFNKSGIQAKHNNLGDFKSQVGEKFTQSFFTKTFKEIFFGNGIITYAEEERNANCNYDFYIRIRNCVFLFEFKDNLFPINEDYPVIKKTIDDRLLGDKGIGQLIKQVEKLAGHPEIFDDFTQDGYSLKNLFVFPVLIYTDIAFGMNGINHYLNRNFKDKLSPEIKNSFYHVYPLTTICFDFFLERYDSFKKKEIDLVGLIHGYHTMMEARIKSNERWSTKETHERIYDEFEQVVWSKYPFRPAKQLNGEFYNYILKQFEPFLPKE